MNLNIIIPKKHQLDTIIETIYELNASHQFYSGYMSKSLQSMTRDIEECITNQTILCFEDCQSVLTFYVNEMTKTIDIAGPFVKDYDVKKGVTLIQHVINIYPDYQLNFFFDRKSEYYLSLMNAFNASFQGDETILTLQKEDFKHVSNTLSIDLITRDEKRIIKEMHNHIFPNVYLTSDDLLEKYKDKYLYVLHDEEKPIGYGLIKLMKEQAFLEIFAIDEPYRSRGLAKPFISTVLHEAFKHPDMQKIFLVVDDINEIAYQLYQKIGFKIQNQNVSYHIHYHV